MKAVFCAVLSVTLPEPVENGCFAKFRPNPSIACAYILSVKNQARLTGKIVGSYSSGFLSVFSFTGLIKIPFPRNQKAIYPYL